METLVKSSGIMGGGKERPTVWFREQYPAIRKVKCILSIAGDSTKVVQDQVFGGYGTLLHNGAGQKHDLYLSAAGCCDDRSTAMIGSVVEMTKDGNEKLICPKVIYFELIETLVHHCHPRLSLSLSFLSLTTQQPIILFVLQKNDHSSDTACSPHFF